MAGYAARNRYRDATLSSMLDDVARRHATREALVFERLAGYKVPRHVWIVPDVPRAPGPHGDKVQGAQLREDALQLLGCER
jgi:hypothetical protein